MAREESFLAPDLTFEPEGTSSSLNDVVDRPSQESNSMVSILQKMNENIMSSNKLLLDLVSQQNRNRSPRQISQEDVLQLGSDCGEEFPIAKRRRVNMTDSSTISVNPNRQTLPLPHNTEDENFHAPALSIAGHHSETRPPVDDVLSLFGEQDIDDDVNLRDDMVDPNNTTTQDAFLDEIDMATAISVPKGPPVADHLAKILTEKFHAEFDSAQRKQLINKYQIPENCTGLYRPRVNPQVWGTIRPEVKSADKSFTALQDAILTASGAIAMSINDILKHRESKSPLDCQSVVSQQIDAITLLGFVCKELSYRRKEAMRPSINPMYKAACGRTTNPTTLLFGDDIAKTMQEVKAMSRITQNISARPSRRNPYQRFGNSASQNNSFLSQRGRGYPPRRGQGNLQPFSHRGKKFSKNWKM